MGRSMSNCGTQAKERARQQRQTDKASKRMLAQRKKAYLKANPSNAPAKTAESVSVENIVESMD